MKKLLTLKTGKGSPSWEAFLEFKLADFWIGAFWEQRGNVVNLWICILPCFPLHIVWWWTVGARKLT